MIVGFHGNLGSGKDTAGERLAQMVAVPSEQISFAHKLKESTAALLDVPVVWLEENKNNPDAKVVVIDGYRNVLGQDFEEPNVIREFSIREVLQRYGTEAHRDVFWQEFWVDQAFRPVDGKIFPEPSLIYVTDVRFPNEIDGIRKRKGITIRVVGKNDPMMVFRRDQGAWIKSKTRELVHPSEWPLSGCSFEINNTVHDDNFTSLDRQLYEIANELNLPLKEAVSK